MIILNDGSVEEFYKDEAKINYTPSDDMMERLLRAREGK